MNMSRKRSNPLEDPAKDCEEDEVETSIGIEGKGSDERRDAAVTKTNDSNQESSGAKKTTGFSPNDWSEEDEVAVLQGFLDYATATGKNPMEDKDGFYQWVKGSFTIDLSKPQVFMKMIRLFQFFDRKYKEPTFAKPHDRKVFDLCFCILGQGRFESAESKAISRRENMKRTKRWRRSG